METQRTNGSSGTNNNKMKEVDPLFEQLKREAAEVVRREPILTPLLSHIGLLTPTPSTSFNEVISRILTHRLVTSCGSQSSSICPIYLQTTLLQCMESSELELGHTMSHAVREDALCVWRRDPACETLLEVVLFMKGWASLVLHRAARRAWKPDEDVVDDGDATTKNDTVDNHHDTLPTSTIRGSRFVSLYLQSICSTTFGVDIHPAAQIGAGVMIDHATGVVIGETATVGDNTTILHGVTLGGTGKESGDRHPKIGKDVLIGAHTQILGNITIGDRAKIGAGSVVLRPIPSGATAVGSPAKIIGFTPRGERPGSMVDVRLAGVEPLVGHGSSNAEKKKTTTMSGGSPLVKSVVSSKKEGLGLSTVSEESLRESVMSEGDTETTTTSTTSANISTGSLGLGIEDDDDDADSTTGDSEDDNITDFGTPAKLHYIKTSHNDTMCPFRNTFCQGTNGKDMISHKKLRSLLLQEGCSEGETVEVFFELLHLVPEDSDARQSGCIPLPIFGRYFPEIAMEKTKLDKETCDAIARGDLRTLGMSKRASRKFKSMFEILGTIPLEKEEEQDLNLANEKYQRRASKEEEKVEKQYSLLDTTGYAEEIAI